MNRQQKQSNDYRWHHARGGSDSACVTRLGQVMLVLIVVAVAYWFWVY